MVRSALVLEIWLMKSAFGLEIWQTGVVVEVAT